MTAFQEMRLPLRLVLARLATPCRSRVIAALDLRGSLVSEFVGLADRLVAPTGAQLVNSHDTLSCAACQQNRERERAREL